MLRPRTVVLGRGRFCSPDDIWQLWRHFWLSQLRKCYWRLVSTGQETAKHRQRTDGPTVKNDRGPDAKSAELEEPGLELPA